MASEPSQKQVALVIGASRGIGRQIAIDLAREGYTVVVSAKSTSNAQATTPFPPDPNSSSSTISTVAREIVESGGTATAIPCDTRSPTSIQFLVDKTVSTHSRIDVLVYNAGAIYWSSVLTTPFKRFKLMQEVNVEGCYAAVQSCLPIFESQNYTGRIILVSPPIYSRFFRGKTAYAMGKVGMSVLTKGLAMDFQRAGLSGMSVTSIWPASAIMSAATEHHSSSDDGRERLKDLRHAFIFSDAIIAMIKSPVGEVNGCLELDEDFLRKKGVTDFGKYSVIPGASPRRIMPAEFPDLKVKEHDNEGNKMDSAKLQKAAKL